MLVANATKGFGGPGALLVHSVSTRKNIPGTQRQYQIIQSWYSASVPEKTEPVPENTQRQYQRIQSQRPPGRAAGAPA
eukprot:3690572-Rhodomonas_salina.1